MLLGVSFTPAKKTRNQITIRNKITMMDTHPQRIRDVSTSLYVHLPPVNAMKMKKETKSEEQKITGERNR